MTVYCTRVIMSRRRKPKNPSFAEILQIFICYCRYYFSIFHTVQYVTQTVFLPPPSPFVTFKNANKSRGILHTSFFSNAFKRNVDTPLTANPWFEKFHKSILTLHPSKSSWNGPNFACSDKEFKSSTVACK